MRERGGSAKTGGAYKKRSMGGETEGCPMLGWVFSVSSDVIRKFIPASG